MTISHQVVGISVSPEIESICQKILVVMRDIWLQLLNICRDIMCQQPSILPQLFPMTISPLLLYSDKYNPSVSGKGFPANIYCTYVFLISSIATQICGTDSSSSSIVANTDSRRINKTLAYQRAEAITFLRGHLSLPKSSPALNTLVSICEDMVKYVNNATTSTSTATAGPSSSNVSSSEESSMNIAALNALLQVSCLYLHAPLPSPLDRSLEPLLSSRLLTVSTRLWRNGTVALESISSTVVATMMTTFMNESDSKFVTANSTATDHSHTSTEENSNTHYQAKILRQHLTR